MGKLTDRSIVEAYMDYVVDGRLEFSGDEFDRTVDSGWSNVVVVEMPKDAYTLRELLIV